MKINSQNQYSTPTFTVPSVTSKPLVTTLPLTYYGGLGGNTGSYYVGSSSYLIPKTNIPYEIQIPTNNSPPLKGFITVFDDSNNNENPKQQTYEFNSVTDFTIGTTIPTYSFNLINNEGKAVAPVTPSSAIFNIYFT
jgi:hypothetical protein